MHVSDMHLALARPHHHLFAVFIDFRTAFDSGSRTLSLEILATNGLPPKMLVLLSAILQKNLISIDDGVTLNSGLVPTDGFAQGKNTSALLFSILIGHLPEKVTSRHTAVKILTLKSGV